jgi:hypothetical protein
LVATVAPVQDSPATPPLEGDLPHFPDDGEIPYHAEQSRDQCPVRPAQVRAARLPPLQNGELVAQDQDLCGLPCLFTLG